MRLRLSSQPHSIKWKRILQRKQIDMALQIFICMVMKVFLIRCKKIS